MRTTSGERRLVSWGARLRLLGLCLTVAVFALAAQQAFQHGVDLPQAVELLHSLRNHWWSVPGFVALYTGLTTLFAPGTLLHLVVGATWGFKSGIWVSLLACNVACNFHFWAARLLARKRLSQLFAGAGLNELLTRSSQNGLTAVLFVRMVPVPMVVANSAVGVSDIRWRDFALGSFLGTLPMVFAYTFFASAILENEDTAGKDALLRSLGGAAVLATVGLVSHAVRKRVLRRASERAAAVRNSGNLP